MAVGIGDLPLDAWKIILGHLRPLSVNYFFLIREAGVFGNLDQLDTFWATMTANEMEGQKPLFDTFPDAQLYASCLATLEDMGLSQQHAIHLTREADGSIDLAFSMLGWYA